MGKDRAQRHQVDMFEKASLISAFLVFFNFHLEIDAHLSYD